MNTQDFQTFDKLAKQLLANNENTKYNENLLYFLQDKIEMLEKKGFGLDLQDKKIRVYDTRDYSKSFSTEFDWFHCNVVWRTLSMLTMIETNSFFDGKIFVKEFELEDGKTLVLQSNGKKTKYCKIGKFWFLVENEGEDWILKKSKEDGEKIEIFIDKSKSLWVETYNYIDKSIKEKIQQMEQETPQETPIEGTSIEQGEIETTETTETMEEAGQAEKKPEKKGKKVKS
jgi:hypothetical protein